MGPEGVLEGEGPVAYLKGHDAEEPPEADPEEGAAVPDRVVPDVIPEVEAAPDWEVDRYVGVGVA